MMNLSTRRGTRRLMAFLMAVLLVCVSGVALAEETVPAPEAEPAPAPAQAETRYVSVFVQQSAASSFTWVGKLLLASSHETPAMSVSQLTTLLGEKGYSLNLNDYAFQYGSGSEMQLSNWLGSERRGEYSVIVFHRAPSDTNLFVLLTPLASEGEEDDIVLEEGSVNLTIGAGPESEKHQANAETNIVSLPYTVDIEVVDAKDLYYYGETFTLKAVVSGTIQEPAYQWEVLALDATEWQPVEGATSDTYSFVLNEENSKYDIRVTVVDAAAEAKGE